jgi:hypothetical protein
MAERRVVVAEERAPSALALLPLSLQLAVFALLPVDCRLRCLEVCRGWRAVLAAERSLWTRLDLSLAGGVVARVTDALLRAASERAGGQLQTLDVSDCPDITHAALLAVVTANAAALRELRVDNGVEQCEALLRAAPQLRVFGSGYWFAAVHVEALLRCAPQLHDLDANVYFSRHANTHRILRNEPPFGPLRVLELSVRPEGGEAGVLALAADLASHAWLTGCHINNAELDTPAAADALMDAVLTLRMTSLGLHTCTLTPAAAPALARLLGGGWLTQLRVISAAQNLDAPAAALLSNALRLNSTLTALTLCRMDLWRDPAAGTALLGALVGHPSLRQLHLSRNLVAAAQQATAGRSLGALVAANAPALQLLVISACELGDAGLGPLVDALASNTHLRTLECQANHITVAFARTRLLPALITNSSLRQLRLHDPGDDEDEEDEERKEGLVIERMIQDAVAARG